MKQNLCGIDLVYGRRPELPLEYVVLELIGYLSSVLQITPQFKISIITFSRKSSRGDFVFSADRLVGEGFLLLGIALCNSSMKWVFQDRITVA